MITTSERKKLDKDFEEAVGEYVKTQEAYRRARRRYLELREARYKALGIEQYDRRL